MTQLPMQNASKDAAMDVQIVLMGFSLKVKVIPGSNWYRKIRNDSGNGNRVASPSRRRWCSSAQNLDSLHAISPEVTKASPRNSVLLRVIGFKTSEASFLDW